MNNPLRRILYNSAAIIIILVLTEITCRFVLRTVYNRDFDSSLIVDNKYHNSPGLKENAHGIVWGKNFITDNFACRRAARPYDKSKKKWLFIGDSVTEGVGVDDSSTFASLVSAMLDSVNIMNYSLIGYSDADYLNILKTLVSKNDTSISRATLFFTLNDVYGNTPVSNLPIMARQSMIGKLNQFLQAHCSTYKLLKLIAFRNSSSYFRYDLAFYDAPSRQFAASMQILKQCDSLCSTSGIKMDVVILPYRSQLSGKYKGATQPQQMVGDFCRKNGIAFSDVYPVLSFVPDVSRLYLFADEIHFSPEGHHAIANFILSH